MVSYRQGSVKVRVTKPAPIGFRLKLQFSRLTIHYVNQSKRVPPTFVMRLKPSTMSACASAVLALSQPYRDRDGCFPNTLMHQTLSPTLIRLNYVTL